MNIVHPSIRIPRTAARLLLTGVLAAALLNCGDSAADGNHDAGDATGIDAATHTDGATNPDAALPPPPAVLEIYALDIWAQPLPAHEGTLTVTLNGNPMAQEGWPVVSVGLREAGNYEVTLEAPEHETLTLSVNFNGGTSLADATFTPGAGSEGHGISVSRETRDLGGDLIPVHTAYLGLRHKWFSAQGRPARRGNQVDLLMDGEEAWGEVYTDLSAATDRVMMATWWWVSGFEIHRPLATHHTLTPTERWANTILGVLESRPVLRRVLVGEFWGTHDILDFFTTDAELEAYADDGNDDFEIMGQGNDTFGTFHFKLDDFTFGDRVRAGFTEAAGRTFESEDPVESTVPERDVDLTEWPISLEIQIASYHQKFAVIDDEVAFVGGMNVKGVDWDTNEHLVFNHRRMELDASQADREEVMTKESEPDFGPRKDYMVRIQGPSVQDVADIFQRRWAHQIAEGVPYSQNSSDFTVVRDQPTVTGGKQLQVTATLPQPFWEHAIAETWFNAVNQAEDYIFIEDQYWRVPMLVDAIVARMNAVPTLRLMVVTKPVSEWTDPGCEWTHATHQQLLAAFPSRYRVYQLKAFDHLVVCSLCIYETESRFMDMDVHSKLLIVDDKFLSVGSANKNNRGIVYEGELNVAVLDPAWVRAARRRIMANMLPPDTQPTNEVSRWWQDFADAATWNDNVWDNWEAAGHELDLDGDPMPASYLPSGFVYSLGFNTVDDCLIEGVGPDMT